MAPTPGIVDPLSTAPPTFNGFRLRRSDGTMLGFTPRVDDGVADELALVDELLRRRIVDGRDMRGKKNTLAGWTRKQLTPQRHGPGVGTVAARKAAFAAGQPSGAIDPWAQGSLADTLADQQPGVADSTIAEVLDADEVLARLRYSFDAELRDRWSELDLAQRTVLGYRGVRDLLIARAALAKKITDPTAAVNFVLNHETGVAEVATYAVLGAARAWVAEKRLKVRKINDDDSPALDMVRDAALPITDIGFESRLESVIEDRIENLPFDRYIKQAKVTWLTTAMRQRLYDKLKSLPEGVLTDASAPQLIPLYAAQVASSATSPVSGPVSTPDDPFQVTFFVEDSSQLQISTAAVKCASQLYYVMTLGDELGVFDAVRYFTHRYLFREGFAVEDPVLRRDLEDYVFSEQFPGYDEMGGEQRMMSTTQVAERRTFYRQVFDLGREPVPGEGMANSEFGRLWKILMLESARYLERAQFSPHPDSYVSKQNVMQAVEDLQYNLSVSCVGMATVMTPLMYAELDFVVNRILGHPEVRKHVVPSGGSWWKVVERLAATQGRRTRASVLHNKARLGYSLLRAVANYSPSHFEQDSVFSAFISDVDAFITTQSILQEEDPDSMLTESEEHTEEGGAFPMIPGMPAIPGMPQIPGMPEIPGMPGVPVGAGAYPPGTNGNGGAPGTLPLQDEWDF